MKPIFGCEVYFTPDESLRKDVKPKLYHLLLLAKNNEGYHNLLKLVSESHVDNFYYKPRTTFSMLQKYGHGIIGSSACIAGVIPKLLDERRFDDAVEWARKFASCFDEGDFYIELQNQGIRTDAGFTQTELNHELTRVAKAAGLKTIATNDFHYLLKEDAEAQDIMLCIGTGSTVNQTNRMKFENDQFYMKTEEEMREAMKDFPEACDNTVEVAAKCDVALEREPILPKFPLPEGETEESWFRKRVQEGAIVAYAMGITDLDPMPNGLMFERFLSPERVEMPDIDVDFEQGRREEVINHIKDVYGEDHVSQVITFGTLQAKNAVRDSARVLDYPYGVGDRICKMIGDELGITIDKALETNPDLKKAYDTEEDVKRIIDAAKSIEGHVRGEGVHACATIICRDPMSDHVPMKRDTKGGGIITQYDGHYTPDLGLLKMDFLGLRTLDVLSIACRNIEERTGTKIVPEEIPTDDEKAFRLMQSGNMDGLFQVEGALYVSLFKRLPPKQFSDVVASIALNRPGPLESGMVEDYIKAAKNPAAVHYYDDRLRPILEETHGTMVYQEQIMQISMAMSGFSAGKSDKLRKAMGKKKLDIMRQLQADWDEGAVANGYPLEIAQQIWADAEKFAKYAFNKSHSAAYAILVMRTAYLKAHYPNDFMAAVLTSYMGNTDRLIRYIASCNKNGTPVLPPDINASRAEFTPVEGGIRFGLVGVRGVGKNVADEIIAEREANGPFTSLHDFVNRLDAKCYNRKTLEALIKGGAFDSTGYTRKQLMYFVEETPLLEGAAKRQKDRDAGQVSMFDMFADDADSGFQEDVPAPDGVEWDKRTKLAYEKEIMKIYVSEHPLAPFEGTLRRMSRYDMGMLSEQTKEIKNGVFVGMISNVATKLTKRGTKMATFTLEDTTGSIECICFKYDDFAEVIQEDVIAKIKGKFESGDRGNQIMAFELEALELDEEDARPSHLELRVPSRSFDQNRSAHLSRILNSYPGRDGVVLFVQQADGRRFRAELPVSVDAQSTVLKAEIRDLFGPEAMIA